MFCLILVQQYLDLVVLIAHFTALLLHLGMRVSRVHHLFDVLHGLLAAALPLQFVGRPSLSATD